MRWTKERFYLISRSDEPDYRPNREDRQFAAIIGRLKGDAPAELEKRYVREPDIPKPGRPFPAGYPYKDEFEYLSPDDADWQFRAFHRSDCSSRSRGKKWGRKNFFNKNVQEKVEEPQPEIKKEPKEEVIEEIINNQLDELKDKDDKKIRKVFKQVDDITDYFIKYYDDNSDIVSECDQIADDLLFKAIGRNKRTLELPLKVSYMKNYCLSSNINNNQIFDSLVWIALRLVAISYCIKYNDSLEDNTED